MRRCKYVIYKGNDELAIVFDEMINHCDMIQKDSCVAAGFVWFDPSPDDVHVVEDELYGYKKPNLKVVCYGKSDSLGGIQSRGEKDAEIIKRMMLIL